MRIVTVVSLGSLMLSACSQGSNGSEPPGSGGLGGGGSSGTYATGSVPGTSGNPPVGGAGPAPGAGGTPVPGAGGTITPGGGAGPGPGAGGFQPGAGGAQPGGGGTQPGGGGTQPGGGGMPASGGGGGMTSAYGCPGSNMQPVPDDPSAWGPWEVGVQTVTIGRLTVELLYPAAKGSSTGMPPATYDLTAWLPESERAKVPADHRPAVEPIGGHIYRGLPIDATHGPYPAVVMIHGTDSIRIANGTANAVWASRGFVVLAADYPGLNLKDALCNTAACKSAAAASCMTVGTQDVPTDVTTQLTALKSPSGSVAFLAGHVDANRIGMAGHSQGACIAAGLSTDSGVQIVLPLAGVLSVLPASSLKSIMYVSGISDAVMPYGGPSTTAAGPGPLVCAPLAGQASGPGDTGGYTASPGPPVKKRIAGITNGGHLSVTDLCRKNSAGLNAVAEADKDMVCGIPNAVLGILSLTSLNDCGTSDIEKAIRATTYATTAALEETLQCADRKAAFANMKTAVPEIGDFHETVQ